MQLSFLQPTVQQPKTSTYYNTKNFEVLARDVHPIDQIEFHKKVGEMIYSTLTTKAMATYKLKDSLENLTTQFKLEKASSQDKDTKIKSLEDLVIGLGHDPSDKETNKKEVWGHNNPQETTQFSSFAAPTDKGSPRNPDWS